MSRPANRAKLEPPRPMLPLPAKVLIAQYLNPYELLKMASASRGWYDFLTSDTAWAHYDVYGIENNIYRHYLKTMRRCKHEEWEPYEVNPDGGDRSPSLYYMMARLRGNEGAPLGLFFFLNFL